MRATDFLALPCWSAEGEWLGELEFADSRGESSLLVDDGSDEISISEAANYTLLLHGVSGAAPRFTPPVIACRVGGANDLFGILNSHVGLGALGLGLESASGKLLWRRILRVRPAKFRDAAEFETMVAEICAWKTALALDMRAHSSAPWSLEGLGSDMAPEEELAVMRAAAEREMLFENLSYVERNAKLQLERDDVPIRLGEGAIDPHRFGICLARGGRHFAVPAYHPLRTTVSSFPADVPPMRRIESVDTPANQFAKFVAISFRDRIAGALRAGIASDTQIARWATASVRQLDRILYASFFSRVGRVRRIDLGDPVLQQRHGYNSILRAWLAARAGLAVAWPEVTKTVHAETRDVPALYELWCLMRVRHALEEEFQVKLSMDHLMIRSGSIGVRRGSVATADHEVTIGSKVYRLRLWYNRTFSPTNAVHDGHFRIHDTSSGTWSKPMKPDFSIELTDIDDDPASSLVPRFLHLDAKYRLKSMPTATDDKETEGTNAADDIDKMHAYLSAISSSIGAHVLYPGDRTTFFARADTSAAVGSIATSPGRMDNFGSCLRELLGATLEGRAAGSPPPST